MEKLILRIGEVEEVTGLSKATIYKLIRQERFPASVPLGSGGRNSAVGWRRADIEAWVDGLSRQGTVDTPPVSLPDRPHRRHQS